MRSVLALAAARNMELHCVDIKTAYLHALFDNDAYVRQPEGFEEGGLDQVCHVLWAVYG